METTLPRLGHRGRSLDIEEFRSIAMPEIRIDVDPAKLTNPDLDIRYRLPERLAEIPDSTMVDNGFDYSDDDPPMLIIFPETDAPDADVERAIGFLSSNTLLNNNLVDAATISTSVDGYTWMRRYPSR